MSNFSKLFGRRDKVDEYYALLEKIKQEKSKADYRKMLDYCSQALPLLPAFVQEWKKLHGEFYIGSIPSLELGCKYWAILNQRPTLDKVKNLVNSVPELREGWSDGVKEAFRMARLSQKIQEYVSEHPGAIQSQLKSILNIPASEVSEVTYWLDKLGVVKRVKSGRSYALYIQ